MGSAISFQRMMDTERAQPVDRDAVKGCWLCARNCRDVGQHPCRHLCQRGEQDERFVLAPAGVGAARSADGFCGLFTRRRSGRAAGGLVSSGCFSSADDACIAPR